jgi:hypothetical protein
MTFCFLNPKRKPTRLQSTCAAAALLTALVAAGDPAAAAGRRHHDRSTVEAVESRAAGAPVMAIVSLNSQRITVYDAGGWILRAPVSSGQKGRETPAGIFSVIQKDADHHSNLYDDAWMPNMHRITWSGIALHGGPLPGYPASHGCVRLPYGFAERLFGATKVGMRVIVAPADVAPVEIAHPVLFTPKPGAGAVAAARAAESEEAARQAQQAKQAATAASRDAAQAATPVRDAEKLKRKADAQLAVAEHRLASIRSDEARQQAEEARAKAAERAADADAQLTAARAEQQAKNDAAASARQASAAAETARTAAAEAARNTARDLEPVSVFISRKTQRLYVRQAFQPILEIPVTIQDVDRPIGTHIFTAMEGGGSGLRWSVVSLAGGRAKPAEPDSAKAALDRIAIPEDALDRIAEMASPRSSLIVSDEPLSKETGKGTDFVVVMSGEPQGGIKFRRRVATVAPRDRLLHGSGPTSYVEPSPFGFPF